MYILCMFNNIAWQNLLQFKHLELALEENLI